MRVLLDTHALLWWLGGDNSLSARARQAIGDEDNEVFVSAASAWEVSAKYRLGKLPDAGPLAVDFAREIRQQRFVALPISLEHAQVAGALRGEHTDPFDRMLIAQALEEKWRSSPTIACLTHSACSACGSRRFSKRPLMRSSRPAPRHEYDIALTRQREKKIKVKRYVTAS